MRRAFRRLCQRWATRLPIRHASFAELFPGGRDCLEAMLLPPGFTGLIRSESGAAYTINPTVYADGVAGTLAGENQSYLAREPDRKLFGLAGAGLIGPQGICYDPGTRTIVGETLDAWEGVSATHPVFSTPGFPPPRELPGTSLSLATLGGQTFYHFLIESLPKLALARPFLSQVDQLLVPRYIESAKVAWLSHLGLEKKIIWLQDLDHWHCEQLLFTNRVAWHYEPNTWCVDALRKFAAIGDLPPGSEYFWLDRSAVTNRRVPWERELAAQFPHLQPVDFGSLGPAKTLATCAHAEALVGLHGAALSNMVFCPPGTKIVEIFTRPFHPWYARLAQVCGHKHLGVRINDAGVMSLSTLGAINNFLARS